MDHEGSVNFGEVVVKELGGLLLIQGVIRQCYCSEGVVGISVLKVHLGVVGDFILASMSWVIYQEL